MDGAHLHPDSWGRSQKSNLIHDFGRGHFYFLYFGMCIWFASCLSTGMSMCACRSKADSFFPNCSPLYLQRRQGFLLNQTALILTSLAAKLAPEFLCLLSLWELCSTVGMTSSCHTVSIFPRFKYMISHRIMLVSNLLCSRGWPQIPGFPVNAGNMAMCQMPTYIASYRPA